jgi:orotate phosphoribosyltransferase
MASFRAGATLKTIAGLESTGIPCSAIVKMKMSNNVAIHPVNGLSMMATMKDLMPVVA